MNAEWQNQSTELGLIRRLITSLVNPHLACSDTVNCRELDWQLTRRLIAHHRLWAPAVHLVNGGKSEFPDFFVDQLHTQFRKKSLRNMLLLHHLLEITAMLDAANIDYIALKGPFLSQYLYNDLNSRISNDLDILIDEKDLDQVDRLLTGRGCQRCESAFFLQFRKHYFRTYNELYYVWPKSRIHVEIHTRLDSNRYHLELSPEEKIEHSVLFETCGQKIRILSDEFMLLYLCDHGSKHYWRQLFWLADIILLRRKMDVMQVGKTQQLLCRYKCHASYELAMQLGDSLMSSNGNTRLKGFPKRVEHMVFSAWNDLCPSPATLPKTASASRKWDYFRYRMFFFRYKKAWFWEWIRLFFLPNEDDFKSKLFPEKSSWLCFFIRPLSLVRRFVFRKKEDSRSE